MQVYHGKSVFGGIAIGKISVFSKKEHKIVRVKINDTNVELARFEEARQTALTQLAALYDKGIPDIRVALPQILGAIRALDGVKLCAERIDGYL